MSFFTSLFSCCLGESENEKSEAVARHARIANIYETSSEAADAVITAPPPCYTDIAHDRPFIPVDEKRTPLPEPQQPPQNPPQPRRSRASSRSSIISVPSTRLSDLTSLRTGTTRHGQRRDEDTTSERNGSWSDSGYDDRYSAPPSYYAGSERSVTPVPELTPPPATFMGAPHPVMQNGWFEQFGRR